MVILGDENVAPPSVNVMAPDMELGKVGALALKPCNALMDQGLAHGQKRLASNAFNESDTMAQIKSLKNTTSDVSESESDQQVGGNLKDVTTSDVSESESDQQDSSESVYSSQTDSGDSSDLDIQAQEQQESPDMLAAMKTIIDATTKLEASNFNATEEEDCTEWQDPVTGVIMGYRVWDECNDVEDSSDSQLEGQTISSAQDSETGVMVSSPLWMEEDQSDGEDQEVADQEWKDQSTGATLGYAVCDDSDEDSITHDDTTAAVYEDEGEDDVVEWKDQSTGATLGYAVCDDSAEDSITHDDSSSALCEDDSEDDAVEWEDNGEDGVAEWEDPTTGAALGYAVCDEKDENILLQMGLEPEVPVTITETDSTVCEDVTGQDEGMEWEDLTTGAVLGYAICDENDDGILKEMGLEAPDALASTDENTATEEYEGEVDACTHTVEWADQPSGVIMGYASLDNDDCEIIKHFCDNESADQAVPLIIE